MEKITMYNFFGYLFEKEEDCEKLEHVCIDHFNKIDKMFDDFCIYGKLGEELNVKIITNAIKKFYSFNKFTNIVSSEITTYLNYSLFEYPLTDEECIDIENAFNNIWFINCKNKECFRQLYSLFSNCNIEINFPFNDIENIDNIYVYDDTKEKFITKNEMHEKYKNIFDLFEVMLKMK